MESRPQSIFCSPPSLTEHYCCWSSYIFLDDECPGCDLEFWLVATDVSLFWPSGPTWQQNYHIFLWTIYSSIFIADASKLLLLIFLMFLLHLFFYAPFSLLCKFSLYWRFKLIFVEIRHKLRRESICGKNKSRKRKSVAST